MVTTEISGCGTPETEWNSWLDAQTWPALEPMSVPEGGRLCVLAAHPDDEVLGAAGLISEAAHRGVEIVMVWATDGEGSHPNSSAVSAGWLARIRRAEANSALQCLGVVPSASHHLGLPDGGLTVRRGELRRRLAELIGTEDMVIAPWIADGHPDHEAVAAAAHGLGTVHWQYPIWMWHWATVADDRVPWHRLRTTPVTDLARKAAAIAQFSSQIRPLGSAPEDAAILPPHVVARFLRSHEWFFA